MCTGMLVPSVILTHQYSLHRPASVSRHTWRMSSWQEAGWQWREDTGWPDSGVQRARLEQDVVAW